MRLLAMILSLAVSLAMSAGLSAAEKFKALIVDGQNNHNWKATTPLLQKHLADSGLFIVEIATSPPKGGDMQAFKPDFAAHQVVVSNYNGEDWSPATQAALVDFVRSGGGLVIVHAADNAFGKWAEYNRMIGLGGWGGRSEKSGPYLRFRDGKIVRDTSAGRGGSHGKQHAFEVIVRDPQHPVTAGLPTNWMHAPDELYDRLRGPAENIDVLATAYSDPATGGTGEHEPMLLTISYGQGRVFHTTLGHSPEAMKSVDFIVTYQRGTQWAASGKVLDASVPSDFPGRDKPSVRE
ncbi:MAG TPA: ThuA domain-containing protein [Pirellulales bacterium]